MTMTLAPSPALLGQVAREDVDKRVRGRARPVRLVGSTTRINAATGEVIDRYSSAQELDGYTWVRCGDRRASRCESCSREYKGDAWHLLSAGLVGGKDAPESVTAHPAVHRGPAGPNHRQGAAGVDRSVDAEAAAGGAREGVRLDDGEAHDGVRRDDHACCVRLGADRS